MKLQYFGDIKDFYKYDLLQHLMENWGKLLLVPFLTKSVANRQGADRNYTLTTLETKNATSIPSKDVNLIPSNNKKLFDILKETPIADGKDYESALHKIFPNHLLPIYLEHFDDENRKKYFSSIYKYIGDADVIFFDPDTGVQRYNTKLTKNMEEYVRYREIFNSIKLIKDNACLIIIQFHRNINTFYKVKFNIFSSVGLHSFALANHKVSFFVLAKNRDTLKTCQDALTKYYKENNIFSIIENEVPVAVWHNQVSIGTLPVAYINKHEIYKIGKKNLDRINFNDKKLQEAMGYVNLGKGNLIGKYYDEEGNIIYKAGQDYYMLDIKIKDLL